jgi:hypothetical protein
MSMTASDILTWIVGVPVLGYIAYRIGRGPFVILGRRLTGSLPLRPPGTEPGAERWYAAAGISIFGGLGVATLIEKKVGYPITAFGLLLFSYTGVLITLDHRGAARAFARRAWSEFGMSVPNPVLSARVIGACMIPIGIFGAVVVLTEAFR